MKRCFLLSLIALFAAEVTSAGVIVLKNGDRITGTVKRIWDNEVFIEPEYADEFSIDQDAIASIEDDRPMEIVTDQEEDVVASLAGADDAGNQVLLIDGQTVAVPLATLEEMDEPEKFSDWEVLADVKTQFDRGNTKKDQYKFSGQAMYKYDKQKHIVDWLYDYERNNDVTTKDRDLYRYNFNYDIGGDWFVGTSAYYEDDPIKGLDYRYNVVPALGYSFWDKASALFNVQFGLGYQEQKNFSQEAGITTRNTQSGGVAALLMRFRYDFGKPDIEIYANNSTAKALYGNKNAVTQFVTGARFEITDLLYANIELDLDYESDPADGADKEDTTILFGLGVEFDK